MTNYWCAIGELAEKPLGLLACLFLSVLRSVFGGCIHVNSLLRPTFLRLCLRLQQQQVWERTIHTHACVCVLSPPQRNISQPFRWSKTSLSLSQKEETSQRESFTTNPHFAVTISCKDENRSLPIAVFLGGTGALLCVGHQNSEPGDSFRRACCGGDTASLETRETWWWWWYWRRRGSFWSNPRSSASIGGQQPSELSRENDVLLLRGC